MKYRSFISISIILLILTIFHILGLLVTYCYWFAGSQQSGVCPSFQRYASPMLKLVIIFTLSIHFLYFFSSKSNFKIILNSFLFLFSILFAISFDLNNHIYELPKHMREISLISSIPSNFDFKEKKVLLGGLNNYVGLKFAGPIFMNYRFSSPISTSYQSFYRGAKQSFNLKNFDYLIWFAEGNYTSSNSLSQTIIPLIDDLSILNRTCIFKIEKNKLEPVFIDAHVSTNILLNSNLKDNYNHWQLINYNNNNIEVSGSNFTLYNSDFSIKQIIHIKSNNYYNVSFHVYGSFRNDSICGKFGNNLLKSFRRNSWNEISEYFYSNCDTNVFLELIGTKEGAKYSSVKIIDLGKKGRNNCNK